MGSYFIGDFRGKEAIIMNRRRVDGNLVFFLCLHNLRNETNRNEFIFDLDRK